MEMVGLAECEEGELVALSELCSETLEHFCDALEVSYSSFAVEGVV